MTRFLVGFSGIDVCRDGLEDPLVAAELLGMGSGAGRGALTLKTLHEHLASKAQVVEAGLHVSINQWCKGRPPSLPLSAPIFHVSFLEINPRRPRACAAGPSARHRPYRGHCHLSSRGAVADRD
jgi:hypothetical protein